MLSSRWQVLGATACLSDHPMQWKFTQAPTHLDVNLWSGCPKTEDDNTNSACMQASSNV